MTSASQKVWPLWKRFSLQETRRDSTSGFWLAHYQRLYVSTQVMNVRRIAFGGHSNVALTSLMRALQSHSDELTLSWYEELLSSWGVAPEAQPKIVAAFKSEWCGDGTSLDPGIPETDRRELSKRVKGVKEWANEIVAHMNVDATPTRLTWGQLKESLDYLGDVVNRYSGLLVGWHRNFDPYLPDWHDPFSRALFE